MIFLNYKRNKLSKSILNEDFFFTSPGLENSIMQKIEKEEQLYGFKESSAVSTGFSTRGWVIAGVVLFVSLAATFFGFEFKQLTNEAGDSFLLPMGIFTGLVFTTYGSLFIHSHLNEFTERFGL